MKHKKKSEKNSNKIIIIQTKTELNYIEKNNKFKDYKKIIWHPIDFNYIKSKKYLFANNFVKKKKKFHFTATIDQKLNQFFKKIYYTIKKKIY